MSAPALDAAPALELEPRIGGGGPPDRDLHGRGWGGDGDGDGDSNPDRRRALYRLGTLLTIVWVTALFLALAAAFWFRAQSDFLWQPLETPTALWASTGVLVLSSWMLELSRSALRSGHWFAYRRRLLLTIYLGLGFIACQGAGLFQLLKHGYSAHGNPHASVFYMFAGAHALHLAGGMVALNWLLLKRKRDLVHHGMLAESAAMYWHFMGLVWVALFVLLLAL